MYFFFSSRRRHTRWTGDWSSDVCSSDLAEGARLARAVASGGAGRRHRVAGVARASLDLCEPEALHAGVELAAAQAEQLRRFRAVLAGLLERALDERALHGLEIHAVCREGLNGRWDDRGG